MFYKIDDIQRDARIKATRNYCRLIVYASYWASETEHDKGGTPLWREGHYMDMRSTDTRIVTDRNGHYKLAGRKQYIDPAKITRDDKYVFEYETVKRDVKEAIRENIEAYIGTGVQKRRAHFDKEATPTRQDTSGLISEVETIKGTGRTKAVGR